jgi:hypothetical protein
MIEYLSQLERLAASRKICLLAAMRKANVSDSQFYRWKQGKGSPRLETARRIERVILGAKHAAALSVHVPKRRMARPDARPAGKAKRARPQA